MTTGNQNEDLNPWHDDVLDRNKLGAVLEDHLINRFTAGNHEPLSLALDGRWGSGKTFFVERWTEQLIRNGRFVISFNAWQHDGAPEPLLALIGELRRQLQDLRQHVPPQGAASKAIEAQVNSAIASAKKAIKPMLKVAASGILKRVIGSSIADFAAATSDEDQNPPSHNDIKLLDKALDTYFDQMLTDYELHKASISKFRDDLATLAHSISSLKTCGDEPIGPLIIIIDELDRCRPNFAVQLLEGIKHLFSVDNVCFVFATNLAQLTASIQVVYGANFSGREYLGRFFDRELTLPRPSEIGFAKLLFRSPLPKLLSMGGFNIKEYELEDQKIEYWLALSNSMNLTLRQQQQAFAVLQTSCEAYQQNMYLPGVWLMFLSQLKTVSPEVFTHLHEAPSGGISTAEFQKLISKIGKFDATISNPWLHLQSQHGDERLISLLTTFFIYSKMPHSIASRKINNSNSVFIEEISRYVLTFSGNNHLTLLRSTFDVVSAAGMFAY